MDKHPETRPPERGPGWPEDEDDVILEDEADTEE